jgi:hypothetical protein
MTLKPAMIALALFPLLSCNSGEPVKGGPKAPPGAPTENTDSIRNAFDYNRNTSDTVPLDAPPRYHPADTGRVR